MSLKINKDSQRQIDPVVIGEGEKKSAIDLTLKREILSILLFCQAHKGDLSLYEDWKNREDAGKKLFYAYYSGLFCRILYILEKQEYDGLFISACEELVEKYHWYDIQPDDLESFANMGACGCEVPAALNHITEIDTAIWKLSGSRNGRDAICVHFCSHFWSFADVRGSVNSALQA